MRINFATRWPSPRGLSVSINELSMWVVDAVAHGTQIREPTSESGGPGHGKSITGAPARRSRRAHLSTWHPPLASSRPKPGPKTGLPMTGLVHQWRVEVGSVARMRFRTVAFRCAAALGAMTFTNTLAVVVAEVPRPRSPRTRRRRPPRRPTGRMTRTRPH